MGMNVDGKINVFVLFDLYINLVINLLVSSVYCQELWYSNKLC